MTGWALRFVLRAESGLHRLGGVVPMQLQRGVRLGSQTTYAAPEGFGFGSPDCSRTQT